MRKQLLLSTAAIGLMLASGLAYAQAPGERREEPKRTEEPARGAAQQHGQGAAERVQEHGEVRGETRGQARGEERAQSAQEKAQGAGREERSGAKNQANEEKNRPATAAEHNPPKVNEQAQGSREGGRDRNREAESAKPENSKLNRENGKASAETKQEKSAPSKSTAESEKSRTGTGGQPSERAGAAANPNERNPNQPPRNAAEQQPPAQERNRPATATDTSRQAPTNAQNAQPSVGAQTNQANQAPPPNTQVNQQARVTSEKQVRMSETLSHEHLAPPEHDLNISIRVGETLPPRVHLYRLPPEIVSIEPEYRDYEYFATDDDVVIVEPRTHRIVSEVPRDPSRARAQLSGDTSVAAAGGGGNVNCRIMRRDASGNVAEVEPSTVGSSARTDSLSVTVQMPGGGSSAPIALGAAAGDIVVATQGQGDCTVTLEPQTR